MAVISLPYSFVPNTTIISAQVNSNFSTLASYVNTGVGAFTAAAGYAVMPGALYIEWGQQASVASDGSLATTVTFNTPFPTACFVVICQIVNAYQSTPRALTVQTTAVGASSFQVNVAGGVASETVTVHYMAIGN